MILIITEEVNVKIHSRNRRVGSGYKYFVKMIKNTLANSILRCNISTNKYYGYSSSSHKAQEEEKMKRLTKYVALIVPLISLSSVAYIKTVHGVENPYKYTKQKERFQKSELHQFQTGLGQTLNGLEQKSDNLEAMNQNLEGRINMFASEKDKLNKAYAQMKAKQPTLEKNTLN